MKAKPSLAIAIIAILAATAATRIQAADAPPAAAPQQQQPAAANPAPPQQQAPPAAAPAPVPPAAAATIPAVPAPDGPGSEIGKMMAEAEQEKARAAMLEERLKRMKLENEIKFGASFMPPPSMAGLPPALPLSPPPSREGVAPKEAKEGGPEKKEGAKAGGRPAVLGVFGDPKDLSVRLSAGGEQRTCKAQDRNCRVGPWRLVSLYGGVVKLTDGKATVAVDY